MLDILLDRVTLIVFMAVVVNGLIEYFIKPAVEKIPIEPIWRDYILRWASAILGVTVACVFRLNLFAGLGLGISTELQGWASIVLTGFLISRGSNWLADLLKQRPTPATWGGAIETKPSGWLADYDSTNCAGMVDGGAP